MAKHCTNCGHELRDSDKFCAECGTAVGGNAPTQPEPVRYEYCEIENQLVGDFGFMAMDKLYRLFAVAVSPIRGQYTAAEAIEWNDDGKRKLPTGDAALSQMVRYLASQGWELMPQRGKNWYSYKFRRPVKG